MKATSTALTTIFAALFLAGGVALGPTMVVASEEDERAGPDHGMMGRGMMGQGMMGQGMDDGMMGRMMECPMMGPGMMGPGMMGPGMMGQRMMPGMMARMRLHQGMGFGPGMIYGMPQVLPETLSENDVRGFMERALAWHGNPRLALGSIEETETGEVMVEIVTQDGSLVQKLAVDRRTGFMRQVN